MTGNVWEWCWDLKGDYPAYNPDSDYKGVDSCDDEKRIIRGGSYGTDTVTSVIASRNSYETGKNYFDVGFRVICP